MSRVAKNTALILGALIVQKFLSALYVPLLTRGFSVDKFGKYILAISFVTLFAVIIDMGLANVIAREVAKQREKAEDFIANILGAKVILVAITIAIITVAVKVLNYPADTERLIFLATLIVILEAIHATLYGALRGLEDLKYESVGIVGGQILTVIIGVSAIIFKQPPEVFILALVAGGVFNAIWSFFALRRHGIKIRINFNGPAFKKLFYLVAPFALAAIFARVYGYLDTVMLSKLSTATSVGIYSASYKLVFVFQFIPIAITSAAYPAMSRAYVESREQLSHIFSAVVRILWITALPITMVLSGMAFKLTELVYTADYISASASMLILGLSLPLAFIYWPLGSMLNATDKQRSNAKIMGLTMILNAVMNVFLIPRFSEIGAAMAELVSYAFLIGAALYVLRDFLKTVYKSFIKEIVYSTIIVIILSIPLHFLVNKISIIIVAPMGGLIYVALLLVFKVIKRSDLNVVASLVKRKPANIPVETTDK